MTRKKIPLSYYHNDDTLFLSKDLLGKVLCTDIEGRGMTAGIITETEAYQGPEDKASHSYNGRRTERNEPMYKEGGHAYVYLCYGIHHLFNIITGKKDVPHGILIRAIQPKKGIGIMLERLGKEKMEKKLTIGPARLTKALGITTKQTGIQLIGEKVWLEEGGEEIPPDRIVSSPRIGIDYAEEDALLPWRFQLVEKSPIR